MVGKSAVRSEPESIRSACATLINLIKLKLNEVLLLYHKMDILAEILTHHNIQLIWR